LGYYPPRFRNRMSTIELKVYKIRGGKFSELPNISTVVKWKS